MIGVTAQAERRQVVRQLRATAQDILLEAIDRNQYLLERAELIATVLEEIAAAVEAGDHWKEQEQ